MKVRIYNKIRPLNQLMQILAKKARGKSVKFLLCLSLRILLNCNCSCTPILILAIARMSNSNLNHIPNPNLNSSNKTLQAAKNHQRATVILSRKQKATKPNLIRNKVDQYHSHSHSHLRTHLKPSHHTFNKVKVRRIMITKIKINKPINPTNTYPITKTKTNTNSIIMQTRM